jgi:hypothetical protein
MAGESILGMTTRWIVDFGVVDSCEVRLCMKLENGDFAFSVASKPGVVLAA